MRNSYADIDGDFWQPPSDSAQKWFAAQQQARHATPEPPPVSSVIRDRLAALEARDGFLRPTGGAFAISPTLALQLHYRLLPEGPKSEAWAPADDVDAELRSMDEARR